MNIPIPFKRKIFDFLHSEKWGEVTFLENVADSEQKINYFSDELFDDREYKLIKPNSLGYYILTEISPDDINIKPKHYSTAEIYELLLNKGISVDKEKIEKQLDYLNLGGFVNIEKKEVKVEKYGIVEYNEYYSTINGIILAKMLVALNKMRTIRYVIRILLEEKNEDKLQSNSEQKELQNKKVVKNES